MTREELKTALEWADGMARFAYPGTFVFSDAKEYAPALASALREAWKEIDRLRKSIWLNHGCSIRDLYGDDGEMQCSRCGVDFKRDSVEVITRSFGKADPINPSLDAALNENDGIYRP